MIVAPSFRFGPEETKQRQRVQNALFAAASEPLPSVLANLAQHYLEANPIPGGGDDDDDESRVCTEMFLDGKCGPVSPDPHPVMAFTGAPTVQWSEFPCLWQCLLGSLPRRFVVEFDDLILNEATGLWEPFVAREEWPVSLSFSVSRLDAPGQEDDDDEESGYLTSEHLFRVWWRDGRNDGERRGRDDGAWMVLRPQIGSIDTVANRQLLAVELQRYSRNHRKIYVTFNVQSADDAATRIVALSDPSLLWESLIGDNGAFRLYERTSSFILAVR